MIVVYFIFQIAMWLVFLFILIIVFIMFIRVSSSFLMGFKIKSSS